jgi:RimJ/RimL family protein N-acetyltransferase
MGGLVLPVLSDERIVLRGWRRADPQALQPACGDPQTCRFTTVPRRYTIEDARDWIARQQAQARNGTAVVLAIVPLPDDRPIGMVGLFGLDEPGLTARLGLLADRRGAGTRVGQRCDDARDRVGVHSLTPRSDPDRP